MAKVPDYDLKVSKFELTSHCYVHFRNNTLEKSVNPLIPPAIDLIAPLPFFYKYDPGIKQPMKVDIVLNKETKPN